MKKIILFMVMLIFLCITIFSQTSSSLSEDRRVFISVVSNTSLIEDVIEITIGGEVFYFYKTEAKEIMLSEGLHTVEIKIGAEAYVDTVSVKSEDNIYTIVVGKKDENNILQAPYISGLTIDEENIPEVKNKIPIDKNIIVSEYQIYNTLWFNDNPYSEKLKMTKGEYNYLKAIAYYNDYISGSNTANSILSDAKTYFNLALLEDNVDVLNIQMYLAFISLLQSGDNSISDKIISEAIILGGETSELYPTMLYWRIRFKYMRSDELLVYKERLNYFPENTAIFDYTTGRTLLLSDALSLEEQPVGYSILLSRGDFEKDTAKEDIMSSSPIINTQINIGNMSRATRITLSKNEEENKISFEGKIYKGSNIIDVIDGNTFISVSINAGLDSNYILTFVLL